MPARSIVFVSASRSRWIAKSGGQGGDLAIPAEQVAQTKIMACNHVLPDRLGACLACRFAPRHAFGIPCASASSLRQAGRYATRFESSLRWHNSSRQSLACVARQSFLTLPETTS